jgi:hypothetical protein
MQPHRSDATRLLVGCVCVVMDTNFTLVVYIDRLAQATCTGRLAKFGNSVQDCKGVFVHRQAEARTAAPDLQRTSPAGRVFIIT